MPKKCPCVQVGEKLYCIQGRNNQLEQLQTWKWNGKYHVQCSTSWDFFIFLHGCLRWFAKGTCGFCFQWHCLLGMVISLFFVRICLCCFHEIHNNYRLPCVLLLYVFIHSFSVILFSFLSVKFPRFPIFASSGGGMSKPRRLARLPWSALMMQILPWTGFLLLGPGWGLYNHGTV